MINLLPLEEKRGIKRQYLLRVITAFLWVVLIVVIVGGVLLIPSYLLSSMKESIAREKMSSLEKRENFLLDESTSGFVTDTNSKLEILAPLVDRQKMRAGAVFAKILANRGQDIRVTSLSFSTAGDGARSVQLGGTAASRESLLSFLKKFEADGSFAKADLPIGSFIKNKDLEFNFSLKLAD